MLKKSNILTIPSKIWKCKSNSVIIFKWPKPKELKV